jgi:hypothetical protein
MYCLRGAVEDALLVSVGLMIVGIELVLFGAEGLTKG